MKILLLVTGQGKQISVFLLKFLKKQGTLGWQNYLFFKLFLYKFINTEQKSDLNSACLKKKNDI